MLTGYSATLGYSAGCLAGSTDGLLWWETRRDPLASYSGILSGMLCGIHWRPALVGYSATRRDPLASRSGGIPTGGRAALAGYSAGSTGELNTGYWVGVWCRSIANANSNIKSNNPSGGEQKRGNKNTCCFTQPVFRPILNASIPN